MNRPSLCSARCFWVALFWCAAPASPPGSGTTPGASAGAPLGGGAGVSSWVAGSDNLGPGTQPSVPAPRAGSAWSAPGVPEGPPGTQPARYDVPAPKSIPEALGGADSVFPVGFEGLSFDWSAADLVSARPWVVNEGRLAPPLAYVYREAAYDAGTGRGDNPWLVENATFGVVEYHFQRDASGRPAGPLHKVVFVFEVSLPKDAVSQVRESGAEKWGEAQTRQDAFQLSFDQWDPPDAEVRFYYAPGGAIAESIEVVNRRVPAVRR